MVSKEARLVIIQENVDRIFSLKDPGGGCRDLAGMTERSNRLMRIAVQYRKELRHLDPAHAATAVDKGWRVLMDNTRAQVAAGF